MKAPKFSVIIPVYNVENYLSQCLDSVVNQTMLDVEIICVNDGTKDRSRTVLEKYQAFDDRIQIIDKENGGISSARNAGLKAASGEYIVFLDSDDYIETNTCERLYYEVLEHYADIIVFGGQIFPTHLETNEWLVHNLAVRSIEYHNGGTEALFHENGSYPFSWRCCFKRDFLIKNQLLFCEEISFAEDLVFQFMTFPMAKDVIFIADKLYHYRWKRPNSLMENAGKDLYKKYKHHLQAMRIIAEYWKRKGLLEQYAKEFMNWTVLFMGWDMYQYNGYAKQELIRELREFWSAYQLKPYAKYMDKKLWLYYIYFSFFR